MWIKQALFKVGLLDVKPGIVPQARDQLKNTENISSAISSQQISGKKSESK